MAKNWEDLEQLLGNRFCPPAWAFIPQVRNGTGFTSITRTADAIAMGLYPSRGLNLHGFEIKVGRTDWLRELRNPEKAEEIAQSCDFWWVVAPKDIIKVEEVPDSWGLMIPFGATTKVIKKAEQLKPIPIDKSFLAAILRRTQETITPDAKLKTMFKKGEVRGQELAQHSFEYEREEYQHLKAIVINFEQKVGVHLDGWRRDDIADAVKMVLNGEHLRAKEQLRDLFIKAKAITKNIEEQLKGGNQ